MADTGPISVRAIKGKFEQLQEIPQNDTDISPSSRIKRQNVYPPIKSLSEDSNESITDSTPEKIKSLSSHNLVDSSDGNIHGKSETSQNQLQKTARIKSRNNSDYNSLSFSDNFSSFSEKQKLVESIVNNIKKSSNNKKSKEKLKTSESKESLSFTSKFEKDLKNALQKGVIRKYSVNKEQKNNVYTKNKVDDVDNVIKPYIENIQDMKKDSDSKVQQQNYVVPNLNFQQRLLTECDNNDYHTYENYPFQKSKKFNTRDLESKNTQKTSHLQEGLETTMRFAENQNRYVYNIYPLRPPRKNKINKLHAPISLSSYDNLFDESEMTNTTESPFNNNYYEFNNNQHTFMNPGTSLPYLSTSPINGHYDDFRKQNLSLDTNEYAENFTMDGKEYKTIGILSSSDSSINMKSNEIPPKKPPRTFAHDIYKSLKSDKLMASADFLPASSVPKLTQREIDSLYTKPIKKENRKPSPPTSLPPSSKNAGTILRSKPNVAPKPVNLMNKAKQRLSVVEPLPSFSESKDNEKQKLHVKRNSSLRLSFKKPAEIASNISRNESPIGRKLRLIANNLRPKRDGNEKNVRFDGKKNDEFIYNVSDESPIYATPNCVKGEEESQAKELHYMCSPLFKEAAENISSVAPNQIENFQKNEEETDSSKKEFRERIRLFDNLKKEFRQSCRNVRRKFNGNAKRSR